MSQDPSTAPPSVPEPPDPVIPAADPQVTAGTAPSAAGTEPLRATARKRPLRVVAVAAIAVIGILLIARIIPMFGSSPEDVRRRLEAKELHAAEGVQKEAEGLALARLQDFAARGSKAEGAATEFETELARWDREVLP